MIVTERTYQPGDLPGVVEVYTASIHSLCAPYYSTEQLAAWAPAMADFERWRERLAALHTRVAECNGRLAGFISYREDGYLDFLFTHPGFARRGIATGLYVGIEAILRARNLERVFAHVSLAARSFFAVHGFEVDAEETVECRGAYLRRFAMHKTLLPQTPDASARQRVQ